MQFGNDDLAKYTFLPQAGDFIRAQGISISDLSSQDYQMVIKRAEQRVLEAIKSAKVSDKTGENREVEIMSFPVSLMLVRSTNLDHLMARYALAEAIRVENFLNQERNERIIEEIFHSFIGIELEHSSSPIFPKFRVRLSDYVKRANEFHKQEWKLVNRIVQNGKVYVSQHDLIRLIREEIRSLILQRLKDINVPKLPENLSAIVKKIIEITPPPRSTYTIVNTSPENYPPCAREALRLLEKGENVPHYGRFLIVTYLLAAGKSVDDIVSLFAKAPDFKQSITKYQVEHIAGLKGGRTRYKVPSCKTLQTHNFCFKDPVKCYEITNPVEYPSKKTPPTEEEEVGGGTQKRTKRGASQKTAEEQQDKTTGRRREWTKPRR